MTSPAAAAGLLLAAAFCLALLNPAAATSASLVGINYGRVADNLPPPEAALPLLASVGVGRVRLYDADPAVLHAFGNTGVELVVGIPDKCVAGIAADPSEAAAWLRGNVQPYVPATKIAALTVGNEVLTGNSSALAHALLPAMANLHSALAAVGLDKQIAVTSAHSLAVLSDSYPPSVSVFKRELLPLLCPILDFHAKTGSPFLVNAYPYFAYADDPTGVDLGYALLDPEHAGVIDNGTGLHYPNLLLAQVDAVYHAMAAANPEAAKTVEVRVSETGWPSSGDANETGANPQNAAAYNGNVMKLVALGKGTPLRSQTQLRAYVFALYNENQKPGPSSERNYGLFKPDGTPVYQLLGIENFSGEGSNGSAGGYHFPNQGGMENGYYDIAAALPGRQPWMASAAAAAITVGVTALLMWTS